MSLKNLSAKNKIPKHLKSHLNNKKINKVFKRFEKSLNINDNFAVAVSGGPDSLALAFLAKIYSIKKNIIPRFFIVDHQLRKESSDEAKSVKKILKKLLINAEILTWKGKKPVKNIQSLARKKRYQLLFNKCNESKIKKILLGHHLDDLIENFFIRILRGSGLKGLISLDQNTLVNNFYLLRPLLYENKEDLIHISKKVFNFYVQDPSNNDDKYKRIILRKLIKELQKNGLDKKKLTKTIANLKYSNKTVNFYTNENLKKNTFFSFSKNKLILNEKFFNQPHEVVFRSLSQSISLIGKKYYSVRGKKIDKIISEIKHNRLFRSTLGGCVLEKVNQTVIITKEH